MRGLFRQQREAVTPPEQEDDSWFVEWYSRQISWLKEFVENFKCTLEYDALNVEQRKELDDLIMEHGVFVIEEDKEELIEQLERMAGFYCRGAGIKIEYVKD